MKMKASHKTMLITVVVALAVLAAINSIEALKPAKELINGKSGMFG
ncbi:hypothetical protein VH1807_contig00043-0002 [Vibrio harveyi]|nr:hypothetical protein [Vibrio harveyi]GEA23818.1 hypothetical protein VH1807_contig00043-0002 [Vibrio harveyi]